MDFTGVVLVVDRAFSTRVHELPKETPVWIVDSPENRAAIAARLKEKKATTSFRDSPELTPADLAARLISTIEEHHGLHSQEPPFSRLIVIGAAVAPSLTSSLAEIGFRLVSTDESTLEFVKENA